MLRVALIAFAILAMPAAGFAQSPLPAASTKPSPAKPKPRPSYPGSPGHGHGHNGHNGAYQPTVVIDARDDVATPQPHHSNPPSTFTGAPHQDDFGSISTGNH
jgi:hypothetical protein